MDPRLPPPLQAPLRLYAALAESALGDDLVGVYLHGSVALGAFGARGSDVDFVTVVRREPGEAQARRLARAHRELLRATPWAWRMEGVYVPADALAPDAAGAGRLHLAVNRGWLRGRHRLPAVATLLLRERGVVVCGDAGTGRIFPPVGRAELDAEMWYNLNVYWAAQLRRPHMYLLTPVVDFAVSTLPRVLHTLDTGEIISKPRALALLAARDPEWRGLAAAALERLGVGAEHAAATGRSARLGPVARARAALSFIRAMIARGNGAGGSARPARAGGAA